MEKKLRTDRHRDHPSRPSGLKYAFLESVSNKPPYSFEILMYILLLWIFEHFHFIQFYFSVDIRPGKRRLLLLWSVYATPYTVYLIEHSRDTSSLFIVTITMLLPLFTHIAHKFWSGQFAQSIKYFEHPYANWNKFSAWKDTPNSCVVLWLVLLSESFCAQFGWAKLR